MVLEVDSEKTAQEEGFLTEFANTTTAHGIRNIALPNTGLFRRCVWLLAFLAALGYLIFQLVTVTIDYYSYPARTLSTIIPMSYAYFPSVTICELNMIDVTKLNNSEEIKLIFRSIDERFWYTYMNVSIEDLRSREPYKTILNQKYEELIKAAGATVNESFQFCAWQDVTIDCIKHLQYVLTPLGQCLTFNGKWSSPKIAHRPGSRGGFYAVMKTNQEGYIASEYRAVGYKIVLHDIYDMPDMYSRGLIVGPGFHYDIAFHLDTFSFLPSPYKVSGNKYCRDVGPTSTNAKKKQYSQIGCAMERADRLTAVSCGCQPNNCTVDAYLTCYRPTFADIYENATREDFLGCEYPCFSRRYMPVISQAYAPASYAVKAIQFWNPSYKNGNVRESYLSVNMYFEDLIVRSSKHVPEYDSLTLMGTIGGNIGLFLGASFLTMVEILELVLITMTKVLQKLQWLFRNRTVARCKIDC